MKKMYTRMLIAVFAFSMVCLPVFAINVTDPSAKDAGPDAKTVNEAMSAFKNLSKKEKHQKFRDVRKALKEFKASQKSAEPITTNTLLLVLIAILLPPLAVYLHEGSLNSKFWISLLLTLLFYLPGLIYALIVILS
jgi:uncharacterized membrane protein YqaE (UPF0057 family)